MGDISTHFSRHEADCHDGTALPATYLPNARALATLVLEPIREAAGGSRMDILSWWRTVSWNKHEGGEDGSFHLNALAADLTIRAYDTGDTRLWNLIRMLWSQGHLPALGGLGRYVNRVHCDARPHEPGVLVEWDKRPAYVGPSFWISTRKDIT